MPRIDHRNFDIVKTTYLDKKIPFPHGLIYIVKKMVRQWQVKEIEGNLGPYVSNLHRLPVDSVAKSHEKSLVPHD